MPTGQPVILVGGGPQGGIHLRAWRRAGAEVTSVVDMDRERAKALARRFNIASWFTSLEAALGKVSRPAIVDIVTPPHSHKDLILAALEGGAAVLVEKPMVLMPTEGGEIRRKAEELDLSVCVMHSWLFEPVMRKAFEILNKGAIGNVHYVHIQVLNTPREVMISDPEHWVHDLPAGRVEETLPHVCYLLNAFLGQEIDVVRVTPAKWLDMAWVKFDALTGIVQGRIATGTFHLSFASGRESVTVDLVGETGVMRVYLLEGVLERSYISPPVTKASRALTVLSQGWERLHTPAFQVARWATRRWVPGHLYVMRNFLNAVRGQGDVPVTLDEAEATVRLTHEIVDRALSAAGER